MRFLWSDTELFQNWVAGRLPSQQIVPARLMNKGDFMLMHLKKGPAESNLIANGLLGGNKSGRLDTDNSLQFLQC
jgi:hypothetical protein